MFPHSEHYARPRHAHVSWSLFINLSLFWLRLKDNRVVLDSHPLFLNWRVLFWLVSTHVITRPKPACVEILCRPVPCVVRPERRVTESRNRWQFDASVNVRVGWVLHRANVFNDGVAVVGRVVHNIQVDWDAARARRQTALLQLYDVYGAAVNHTGR